MTPEPNHLEPRILSAQERSLISFLAEGRDWELDNALVVDLREGGMGSIRFVPVDGRRRSVGIAEAQFTDADGVIVSLELSVDDQNRLFELDLWKVDFSKLCSYPCPQDLKEVRIHRS